MRTTQGNKTMDSAEIKTIISKCYVIKIFTNYLIFLGEKSPDIIENGNSKEVNT